MNGVVRQQPIASLGDHHGIDDEVGQVERFDRCGDGFDDGGGGEHAGLHRVAAEVGDDRFDLQR